MRSPALPRIALLTAAAFVAACTARAQVPTAIHYQGRLLDATGTPVNAAVSVAIGLYTNDASGAAVYMQTIGSVTAINGMFDFAFGTNTLDFLSVFTNAEVWAGVTVDGDILAPRQRLVSVPFALSAGRVPDLILSETGTAVGVGTDARAGGVAIGYQAVAYNPVPGVGEGTAIGQSSVGHEGGTALGFEALGYGYGVAAGYQAQGYDYGMAAGYGAFAAGTNVAVGAGAAAVGAWRTALGPGVITEADNSTAVRGSLFLDGASGIYHRPSFGSGAWIPGLPGGWSGIVTNITGATTQLLYFGSGVLTNVVHP